MLPLIAAAAMATAAVIGGNAKKRANRNAAGQAYAAQQAALAQREAAKKDLDAGLNDSNALMDTSLHDANVGAWNAAVQSSGVRSDAAEKAAHELDPWVSSGKNALKKIDDLNSGKTSGQDLLNEDPGYKFRIDQAQQSAERGAAAKGGLMSGTFATALADHISAAASGEFAAAYARLFGMSEVGRESVGAQNQYRTNAANLNAADFFQSGMVGSANTLAAGRVKSANAFDVGKSKAALTAGSADLLYQGGRDQAAITMGTGDASASMYAAIGNSIGNLVSNATKSQGSAAGTAAAK